VTVGLAIIARDEADNLPGLLDSVRGAFDQVVLCDTGSTDDTVDVFRSWAGAQDWGTHGFAPWKVDRFAWRDDFAAARNHADGLLDTEWSSWADCDDVVRGAGRLRGLARGAPPDVGAFVAGYDYARLAGGTTMTYLRRERLVRRSLAGGWVNRVHESQWVDGEAVLVGADVCEWVHRKWLLELGEAPPTPERNLRILHRWVADEPDHAFALSCLALELRARGEHREAVRWFRRYLRADPGGWPDYRAQMLRKLATCHLLLGEPWPAMGAARAARRVSPSWPDSRLTLAEAHLALHAWRPAERWAREALDRGPPDTELGVNPLDYTFGPRLVLAGALAGRGRFREAIVVGEEARELVPGHAELERQLRAWRDRELAPRATASRAPRAAAAAAMVAALVGAAPGASAAPPSGPHNELGAVTWLGVPINPPSTTGSTRPFRIFAVGGGHQLKGSQYVPFISTFDASAKPLDSFVIPGFGRANSDVVSIFPFLGTTLLGIDQTTTGRIAALTPFGQADPTCRSQLGPRRPLSFDRGYLSPFLAIGGTPGADDAFYVDLFNPSTCRDIASARGVFDPSRATDVNTFVFAPGGVVAAGGAGSGASEEAAWSYTAARALIDVWEHGVRQLPAGASQFVSSGLPGAFTDGVPVGPAGFDVVGLDRTRGLFYGACGNSAGQLDPRCGTNGTRVLLDLDPTRFAIFNPQLAGGREGLIVSLPYDNLQDGTSHVRFLNLDPLSLVVRRERDIVFPSTTRVPGLAVAPNGNVLFGITTRNLADPSNPLNNNRIGMGVLNSDFEPLFPTFVQNSSPNVSMSYGPVPASSFSRPLPHNPIPRFAARAGGGARAQAAAAGQRRIVRVQFAAVRLSGTGNTQKCAWLKDRRARFVADTPIRGSCQGARWVTARKGRGGAWTLRLTRPLPRGRYFGYSRATNAAGVTERSFSAGRGNRLPFRIP
jgi:tetratricopeptide (TPR) repeat protein